jgi:hypothetical protein
MEHILERSTHEAESLTAAADSAPRCGFIKPDGEPCGSPAVKKAHFCHFHRTITPNRKKKKKAFELPVLEDNLAIQIAVTNVCRSVLEETLEPKRAATLLYGLQVASTVLKQMVKEERESKEREFGA